MASPADLTHLSLAVSLAREALHAGDAPFGSVLVSRTGAVLQTDRNRTVTGSPSASPSDRSVDGRPDATLHPEFTLARWAQLNLAAEERAAATVYTSGEHCAMCAAAHAYCGLGAIVYASSTAQYGRWMAEYGVPAGKLRPLAIGEVAPGLEVRGPVGGLEDEVKALHVERWTRLGYAKKG